MIITKREHPVPAAAHPFDVLAIVFVTLLLATASWAYVYYSKWKTAELTWNRATVTVEERVSFKSGQDTVEDLYTELDTLEGERLQVSHILGYYRGEEAASNIDTVATELNAINTEFGLSKTEIDIKSVVTQQNILTMRTAVDTLESKIEKLVNEATGGTLSLEKERDKLQGEYTKQLGAVGDIRVQIQKKEKELQEQLDGVLAQVQAARKDTARTEDSLLKSREGAREQVKRAQRDKKAVEQRLYKVEQKYKDEVDILKDTLKNVEEGVKTLEDIVRTITDNEKDRDQSRPDGKLLSSSTKMQVAWIGLTRRDRLLNGMLFEVFRYKKGGKEVERGKVQVIQVGETMSKVKILERSFRGKRYSMELTARHPDWINREFELDPLGAGDLVRNRHFDKEEPRVFVFAGRLTGPPDAKTSYKTEEAVRLIEEIGDKVHKDVGEQTSFLVLGKDYDKDPNFKKAEELGIPKMSEKELLEVLGKYQH